MYWVIIGMLLAILACVAGTYMSVRKIEQAVTGRQGGASKPSE